MTKAIELSQLGGFLTVTEAGAGIGLGTTSPNTYTNYTTVTLNGTNGGEIDFEVGGTLTADVFANSGGLFLNTRTADPIVFSTNNGSAFGERLRITSGGQLLHGATSSSAGYNLVTAGNGYRSLLIGSTSGSTASLIIDGAANGDGAGSDYASIEHNADGTMRYKNRQSSSSGGAGHIFYTTSSDTEKLRITSDGKVGIGTWAHFLYHKF